MSLVRNVELNYYDIDSREVNLPPCPDAPIRTGPPLTMTATASFVDDSLAQLCQNGCCSYTPGGPWAAEPAAWGTVALLCYDRIDPALSLAWTLADAQADDGGVGVIDDHNDPAWPTSLAILAWHLCQETTSPETFAKNLAAALNWTLHTHGKTADPQPEVGHDPRILGWSWAENTHAWMEPTCMFAIALKRAGYGDHPRTREAVRLVTDRLLPTGGSNFGSTIVLGQATLPQVQSTGLAMMALAGEKNTDSRVAASLEYLEREISGATTTSSLCFGVMGLAAHGRRPARADEFLELAWQRELARGPSTYKLALLALAAEPTVRFLGDAVGENA